MLRSSRICLAAVGIALAIVSAAYAQNTDYFITSWAYGVVVWPGRVSTYLTVPEQFVGRLASAAREAFAFWGFDPPEPLDAWESPVAYPGRLRVVGPHDVRIVDDATGEETLVPNLAWEGHRLSPLVVIPFVGGWRMLDALGATATFGAQFCYRPLVRSYPDAEDWVHEVGRGYRTIVCASYAGDDVLIHECTHWFQWEWCAANDVVPQMIPKVILEGMAEAASAHAENPVFAPWELRAVLDWAEEHCLSDGVGAASAYTVGESLVTYLVDELGPEGFLATLSDWALRPAEPIALYEPGWRASLGLPRECGAGQGDAE
jgi:hypothetical protein